MIIAMLTAVAIQHSIYTTHLQRPCLTVAQGMVESGLNTKARSKNGKRFGYKGAYQVIEKEHGKVPKGLIAQAQQAEKILDDLMVDEQLNMFEALVRYNSFKNKEKGKAYARKVRRQAIEVSLLDLL